MRIPSAKRVWAFPAIVSAVLLLVTFTVKARWVKPEVVFTIPPQSLQIRSLSGQLQLLPSIAVIAGIPVTVTQAAVNLGSGARILSYSLVSQAGNDISEIQLLLLDFGLKGELQSVNGWVERAGLRTGQRQGFNYELRTAVTAQSRLVLAIVDTTSSGNHWRVSPARVVQSLVNVAANHPEPLPSANAVEVNSNGYEPDFCFMATQQVSFPPATGIPGQTLGVTFFTCDQFLRSYVYGYRSVSAQ